MTLNQEGDTQKTADTGALSILDTIKENFLEAIKSLGQIGQLVNTSFSGASIISTVFSEIARSFMSIENFGKVFNFLGTIFDRVATILTPLVNQLFAPFVILLETVGDIIGSVLSPVLVYLIELLTPIINVVLNIINVFKPFLDMLMHLVSIFSILGPAITIVTFALNTLADGITFIYNKILMPLLNFVLRILTSVGNFIVDIYNSVVNVLKKINIFGYRPFKDLKTVGKTDYDDVKLQEIESATQNEYALGDVSVDNGTDYTAKSANYTAAKDVIINIYYENSFVNGDARAIALAIRDEIRAADALGY
ncbi:hypothetical protein K7I13_12160 [Brucepastera parasyntrophica]|uniref:hypothetical protein n=1 Tax=Brucepastera parasyntrophica TaxID=2880008 RepID=UPI0021097515|nr:hypothetical protein [Brucepastera parasyntrophica]ULQ59239.1 hypothetical protein K7I13_12160 [Brucepastera parasyntrophica]